MSSNNKSNESNPTSTEILEKLTTMTENLPNIEQITSVYSPIVLHDTSDAMQEVGPQYGYGVGAYVDPDMSLMRIFMAEGRDIARHVDPHGTQWVGVIRGELTVIRDSGEELLYPLRVTEIAPGEPVSFSARTDVRFWIMTMPPSPGCPPPARIIRLADYASE